MVPQTSVRWTFRYPKAMAVMWFGLVYVRLFVAALQLGALASAVAGLPALGLGLQTAVVVAGWRYWRSRTGPNGRGTVIFDVESVMIDVPAALREPWLIPLEEIAAVSWYSPTETEWRVPLREATEQWPGDPRSRRNAWPGPEEGDTGRVVVGPPDLAGPEQFRLALTFVRPLQPPALHSNPMPFTLSSDMPAMGVIIPAVAKHAVVRDKLREWGLPLPHRWPPPDGWNGTDASPSTPANDTERSVHDI